MKIRNIYRFLLLAFGLSSIFIYKKYYLNDTKKIISEKNPNEVVFEDLKIGDGDTAEKGKKVKINYKAALEDGFVFDSTLERMQPFEFTIGSKTVVKGLQEAVDGMQVGGKRKAVVPPKLAFGKNTLAGIIPSDSFIYFEIELLDVK